jgi:transposase
MNKVEQNETLELIAKLYAQGKSIAQVAKTIGLNQRQVWTKMVAAGISRRSAGEGVHLATRASGPSALTVEVQQALDGILLGDGHLAGSRFAARLQLAQIRPNQEWVHDVAAILQKGGLTCRIVESVPIAKPIKGKRVTRQSVVTLRTPFFAVFKAQWQRWYPVGKKNVPADLSLTPLTLAYWYCGDGYIQTNGYTASFCTDGFSVEDVHLLIQKMREAFGFTPRYDKVRNRIQLGKLKDRRLFLELIRPYVPACFSYKLELQTGSPRLKLTRESRAELFRLHSEGMTYADLMPKFQMSKSGIASAIAAYCAETGVARPRRRGRPIELWT